MSLHDRDTTETEPPVRVPTTVYRQLTRAERHDGVNLFADARSALAELRYREALRWVHENGPTYYSARASGRGFVPEPQGDMRNDCAECGRTTVAMAYRRDADDRDDEPAADVYACMACGELGEVRADGTTTGVIE